METIPKPRAGVFLLRVVLPALYLGIPVLFIWTFFNQRGGLAFLDGTDFKTANRLLFPLVGLCAFFLVWAQFMIGTNLAWLRRVFPWILTYHRRQGVFAFLFALTHPTLLIAGFGIGAYWHDTFIAPDKLLFVWFARVALFLMALTVFSALLRKTPLLRRHWHTIHYLNYAVFILIWFHSWNLGSDVQSTWLRYLWMFYGVTAVASIVGRIVRAFRQPVVPARAPINTTPNPPSAPLV